MNLRDEVKLLGSGLATGQSTRVQCPVCEDSERTFSITRNQEGLLYHCFRATCSDTRGFVGTIPEPYRPDTSPRRYNSRAYEGELHPLQKRDYEFFSARFALSASAIPDFSIMRSSVDDSLAQYVLALHDWRGYTRGHLVRRGGWSGSPDTPGLVESTPPKSYTFLGHPSHEAMHVARPQEPRGYGLGTVVVVEDYISSLKVAQNGQIGVSLTGMTMNANRAAEIALLQPREVVIALDKDAISQAMMMARKWGLSWNSVRVLLLQQDIKDMTAEAVKDLLT